MRARWFSKRALLFHVLIAIWFPGCLLAGWWQVTVALSGNALSYLYSVEWPVFAIFGAVVWWHAVHDDPMFVGSRALRRAREEQAVTSPEPEIIARHLEDEDEDLAAYNDYLAELARQDRPKTWRRT